MLTFEVRINDGLIMNGKVRRLEPLESTEAWYTYSYRVEDTNRPTGGEPVQTEHFTGKVRHKYSDGAGVLIKSVLTSVELERTEEKFDPPLFMVP
jgi:hypothetical protein